MVLEEFLAMAAVDETWLRYRFSNTLASKAGIFFCLSTKIAVFADIVESAWIVGRRLRLASRMIVSTDVERGKI